MEFDARKIKRVAQKELVREQFREEVNKMKERLKHEESFWDRIFPWKILIIKKEVI